MAKTHSLDMTQGSIPKRLLQFALPIMISGILQHLYTMADRVVVGNFAQNGTLALAAVGSTSHATALLLNLFNGMSVGANVVCSNFRGARNEKKLRQSMHTAVLVAAVCGVILCVLGVFVSGWLLQLMDTPADVLPLATRYMQIVFLGVPASLIYNFGAAILRSFGDSKRSMYILGVTGLVNVILNLVLVIGFGLDVEGVAIATIVAQYLSALAVLWILFRPQGEYKLRIRELKIQWDVMVRIVAVGVPCSISGIVQSLSNVTIQSAINSFNSPALLAARTAASDINQFSYLIMSAFSTACVSFAGQCYGAKAYKRLDKLAGAAALCCAGMMIVISIFATLFPVPLLMVFNPDRTVAEVGKPLLLLLSWGAILFAVSECMIGCIRGMGKSTAPTVVNILGLCGIRILWAIFVFPLKREAWFLFLCYPISWAVSAVAQTALLFYYRKKLLANAAVK